jgi:RNA polymerase sigma-70 factor (ECF subfamily)
MMDTLLAPRSPLELTDEQVIERVRAGDTQLFEVLMRRYNQRLFRAARAIVKNDVEAEDVIQEAYVRAFAHLGSFEGRARLSTWLTKIVIHEAAARLRLRRRFESMDDGDGPSEESIDESGPSADPERAASSRELAAVIVEAIDRLPSAFRAVFMLRAVEEMSGAETAECLEIPEETVKTRLHRARALLQRELEQRTDASLVEVHRFLAERCDRVVRQVLARLAAGDPPLSN